MPASPAEFGFPQKLPPMNLILHCPSRQICFRVCRESRGYGVGWCWGTHHFDPPSADCLPASRPRCKRARTAVRGWFLCSSIRVYLRLCGTRQRAVSVLLFFVSRAAKCAGGWRLQKGCRHCPIIGNVSIIPARRRSQFSEPTSLRGCRFLRFVGSTTSV